MSNKQYFTKTDIYGLQYQQKTTKCEATGLKNTDKHADVTQFEPEVKGCLKEQCIYLTSMEASAKSSILKAPHRTRPRVHIAHLYLRRSSFSRTPTPLPDSDSDEDTESTKTVEEIINFNSLANPLRTDHENMRTCLRSALPATNRGFSDLEKRLFGLGQAETRCGGCFLGSNRCKCHRFVTSRCVSASHVNM